MEPHHYDSLRTVHLFGQTYYWVIEDGRYSLKRLLSGKPFDMQITYDNLVSFLEKVKK